MAEHDDTAALVDRFFAAIEAGDAQAAGDCYADDVAVWHNTDRIVGSKADNIATLANFIRYVPQRRYEDRRVSIYPGGFVQQHVLAGTLKNGKRVELPACIVCSVKDGRITRLDEYFDSATLAAWSN
jgi:ketosteroid isomerase-like protein